MAFEASHKVGMLKGCHKSHNSLKGISQENSRVFYMSSFLFFFLILLFFYVVSFSSISLCIYSMSFLVVLVSLSTNFIVLFLLFCFTSIILLSLFQLHHVVSSIELMSLLFFVGVLLLLFQAFFVFVFNSFFEHFCKNFFSHLFFKQKLIVEVACLARQECQLQSHSHCLFLFQILIDIQHIQAP